MQPTDTIFAVSDGHRPRADEPVVGVDRQVWTRHLNTREHDTAVDERETAAESRGKRSR